MTLNFFLRWSFPFQKCPFEWVCVCFASTLEKNCSKLKMNVRTSLWMHLSPTTIRDLISFYFKSSVRNLLLFPVEKKINRMCAFPLISCPKNSYPVISLTPTWFNVVPLVQMLSIRSWTQLGLCRFLLQNITCHLLPLLSQISPAERHNSYKWALYWQNVIMEIIFTSFNVSTVFYLYTT